MIGRGAARVKRLEYMAASELPGDAALIVTAVFCDTAGDETREELMLPKHRGRVEQLYSQLVHGAR